MTDRRYKKGRRIFIIGAGMSAECGAPLTREFLESSFTNYAKGKMLDLVSKFISSAYKNKETPDIEEVWTRIDYAILKGENLSGYDPRKLREVRDALLNVLIRILSAVHFRMLETLEWCDVILDFLPPSRDKVDSLKAFLEDPIKWIDSSFRQLPSQYKKYMAKFFDLLVKYDNVQNLTSVLTTFLSQSDHHHLEYNRNCATRLANVLFNSKFHPIGDRKLFLYRLQGLRDNEICGTKWLGSDRDTSGKIIEKILWRIYLLRNHKERLEKLKGWLNTYYLLVQVLREGDTVITTNYDLFLEMALFSWAERTKKYGVLWGTDLTEIRDDFHSRYIPGTAVNYAKWEIEAEGYTESAYQWMMDAEKQSADKKQNEENRKLYEKFLKSWQMKKHTGNWVSVLKLHGSLDWGICRTCKELFTMRLIPFYQAKVTILKQRRYNKAHKTYLLCCHNPVLGPLLVPPTWRKDYDNRVLVSIWSEAEEQLRHADSIIFLGYSLPELDKRIRDLFNKALYNRTGKPWNEIAVVNKNVQNVLSAYKKVFGNVKLVQCKVSNYLRQIAEEQKTEES